MQLKEIKPGLFKISFGESFPIYVRIESNFIRFVQPPLDKEFKEKLYFGEGQPNELVLEQNKINEFIMFLTKLTMLKKLE
jgi:hypothetical protein